MKKFLFVLCFSAMLCGCNEYANRPETGRKTCEVINYSAQVSYANCTGATFGWLLVDFVENRKVHTVIPDGTGSHGYTIGYFIVFEKE